MLIYDIDQLSEYTDVSKVSLKSGKGDRSSYLEHFQLNISYNSPKYYIISSFRVIIIILIFLLKIKTSHLLTNNIQMKSNMADKSYFFFCLFFVYLILKYE